MNPAIAGGRVAERVRSTERSGSVERLRLHGDGFRAHGDLPPSRHVPLHFVQMAFRVSESPTLFSGADRFDNHWILLRFKEPKRASSALARFGPYVANLVMWPPVYSRRGFSHFPEFERHITFPRKLEPPGRD
jgi:hypothetical protein